MIQSHTRHLQQLKDRGFEPSVVYDIGACTMEWTQTARRFWPNATYVLFEAFDMHEDLYKSDGVLYHMGVLSDVSGKTVRFYHNRDHYTGNSYYQEKGNKHLYETSHDMQTMALDDVVQTRGFPLPDFVKIDVQGAERDLIQGGIKTLGHAKHLIVEMQHIEYNVGAPLAKETWPWIESLGWKCTEPLFTNNGADGDYGFTRIE